MKHPNKKASLLAAGAVALASASSYAGWNPLKDVVRAVEQVGEVLPAVVLPVETVIVDVVKGKPVDAAIKETVIAPAKAAEVVVNEVAAQTTKAKALVADKVVGELLGDEAEKVFRDADTLLSHEQDAAAYIAAVNTAVETGDWTHLNPIYIKSAAEIRRVRNQYWEKANKIPSFVIDLLPGELKKYAHKAKYIQIDEVAKVSIPSVATTDRNAIVMDDLIFVTSVRPYATDIRNAYFWTHEMFHVKQYLDNGLPGFVNRYIGDEMSFKPAGDDGINVIEREADEFACRKYPVTIGYIPECSALNEST